MADYSFVPIDFDPFAGEVIEKVLPITASQQEIWMSCMLGAEEANLAFIETLGVKFTGKLDVAIMKEVLHEIVNRHDAFRSSFSNDGNSVIIYKEKSVVLQYIDLQAKSKQEQDSFIDDYCKKDVNTPFDVMAAPLLRFGLFALLDDQFFLYISTHHIVCDGWSFGILLEDISALYNARIASAPDPETPLSFSQYAIEDFEFSQTEEYAHIEKYWVQKFKDNIPSFEIPTDFPRGKSRSYRCNKQDFTLNQTLADAIKKTGATYGSSFVNTIMSAFEVLIYKITSQTDVVIGLPTAGQAATGLYNLIGHCVNFLPLRSHPKGHISFSEYLKIRKSQTIDDYENQRFTFGSLLQKINIKRDATWTPLTPLSFNIDVGMDRNVAFNGLNYEIVYNAKAAEIFDIFLNIAEVNGAYIFQWTYNIQLFRPETIESWMERFTFLLQGIAESPNRKIDDYTIENKHEILASITRFNQTDVTLPNTSTIQLFENNAKMHPDATALIFNNDSFTYNEINIRANKLARFLLKRGIKPGKNVAIILERNYHIIISMLAVMKCGAAYIPLDPEFPDERLQFMIGDAGATSVIINENIANRFAAINGAIVIEAVDDILKNVSGENLDMPVDIQHDAYILYTSGSTGKPKGVEVSQRNLLNLLLGVQSILKTDANTRLLAITTISFDIAQLEILLPLISGGTIVLANQQTVKDGAAIIQKITEHDINLFQATPTTYKIMLDTGWAQKLPVTIISGGEALSKKLADALLERVEALYNMYGPTETTIYSTATQITKSDRQISIGTPIQNTQVFILDEEKNILPTGAVGEIHIAGDGVAKGYLNQPALTADRFIKNGFPEIKGGVLYKTGDLGKYDATGNIICLGRTDQQVKIRGYRIELPEIERAIMQLPGIKDVITIVKTDLTDEQKLVAYIIAETGGIQKIKKQQVLAWRNQLRKTLPQYMIPAEWIKVNSFPVTPNKKIDRNALLQINSTPLYNSPEPDKISNNAFQTLKNIWEQELNIKDIDATDDFFELGGHSMSAIRVMSRIQSETNVKLPISSLFEHPTIGSLMQLLDNNKATNRVVVPIKATGNKQPIFLIHAGGLNILLYKSLSQYLDEDQPLYGLQGLGLDGELTHLDSIESIARRYLIEVIEHDPEGPYILVGYSYGGIIAYEMARQLMDMGKKVKFLGILDTNVSERSEIKDNMGKATQFIARQSKKLLYFSKNLIKYPKDVIRYQQFILNKKFNKNYQESNEDQIYDYGPDVVDAYEKAYYNYKLMPLDIAIHLFRVQKRIYYVDDPLFLGWKQYAKKGIKIHVVPGDHKTFLLPPNSEKLMSILQKSI